MSAAEGDAPTIVVGYDGREPAEHALEQAIQNARETGARVVAVVVGNLVASADPYGIGSVGWEFYPPVPEGGPPELQPLLNGARERLDAAGVEGEAVWGLGDPATEILRVAEETGAKQIVVGHHHHSALGRLLGTDVDSRIADAAGCDVIVTP